MIVIFSDYNTIAHIYIDHYHLTTKLHTTEQLWTAGAHKHMFWYGTPPWHLWAYGWPYPAVPSPLMSRQPQACGVYMGYPIAIAHSIVPVLESHTSYFVCASLIISSAGN